MIEDHKVNNSEERLSLLLLFKNIKKIILYYKDYKYHLIISVILAALYSVTASVSPKLVQRVFDYIDFGLINEMNVSSIIKESVVLVVLYLFGFVFSFVNKKTLTFVTNKVSQNIRNDISKKIDRLPISFFYNNQVGDIISRTINDVELIGSILCENIVDTVSAIILFIGIMILMFITNTFLTLTVIISLLIGFVVIVFIMMISQKYFDRQQKAIGDMNGYIEEIYDNKLIVQAFNQEENSKLKFEKYNTYIRKNNFLSNSLSGLMKPLTMFIGKMGYVSVCVVGSLLVFSGKISLGIVISFLLYSSKITEPILTLTDTGNVLQQSAAAGKRIFEILEADEVAPDEEKIDNFDLSEGIVEFDHVHFGYDGERKIIINDFCLKCFPGQKIAIVGPTGAGKTTIINLLLKFYDLFSGDIRIDGQSINEMKYKDIRNQFCVVLQETAIFEGTIKENIIYTTENVTEERIIDVCEAVGLSKFIKSLPNGFDTIIDEQIELSEGQKQQIAIARAMISDRPMLILDEATSSIDTRLEMLIQNMMDKLMEGRTSFVIAHRLSTIRNSDLILVLKDGDVIESGTHDELLQKNGLYSELYYSQFETI